MLSLLGFLHVIYIDQLELLVAAAAAREKQRRLKKKAQFELLRNRLTFCVVVVEFACQKPGNRKIVMCWISPSKPQAYC